MNCKRCGTILPGNAVKCNACGMKVEETTNRLWVNADKSVRKTTFHWGYQLAILLFIVFIFLSVSTPNIFRVSDKAQYTRCVEMLTAIKMGEEIYMEDYGLYTDDWDRLAHVMMAGCTAQDGSDCKGEVLARIKNNCDNPTLSIVGKGTGSQYDYKVQGEAFDRFQCKICVTPAGYYPDRYDPELCETGECL